MTPNPPIPDPSAASVSDECLVLSVDDNPMIGDVIGMLLRQSPGLKHAGHFLSDAGVVARMSHDGVRMVVLDYEIPGADTLALLRQIKSACPDCAVLMLSAHARPEIVDACRKAGASGYISKDRSPTEIREAIKTVAKGGMTFMRSRQGSARFWDRVRGVFDAEPPRGVPAL